MIDKNKAEFEKMNILKWREAGYTGKGYVGVVLDTPHKPYPHTKVSDPFNNNNDSYGHKGQVAQVIREVAPDADITVFSWTKSGKQEIIDWIKAHESEIDVINVSLAINTSIDLFKQLEQFDIPVIVSSGNGSKSNIQPVAAYPWTIAVGAWEEYFDKKASYSNYGTNLDGVAYTNIYIDAGGTNPLLFNGTSCSAPVTSSLIKIYNEWRKENGLPKMTRNEAREFLHKYALDKEGKGYDVVSGWGLFRLPSEVPVLPKPEPRKEEPVPESEKPVEVINSLRLIIDAGHGGEDTGGYSGGYREKDLNLVVAKRVKELLKEYSPSMTREDDKLIVWNDRANLIKDKYDVCISLHLNIGGGTGVEAIHSYVSTRGKAIATSIVDSINKIAGIPKRPNAVFSKRNAQGDDYYYMHRLTGSTTTVIVESCFLDNDVDKMMLNVEKIAQAIASGFKSWVGENKTSTPTPSKTVSTRTFRSFESDVHVLDVPKGYKISVDLGIRFKLETVLSIVKNKLAQGKKILGATNCGFFVDGNNEHVTLYIADGKYYNPPSINSVDFIYYKDGHTEITNLHGYDQAILSKLQADAHWAIGTSYCLVKDGKINLMLTEKYAHSKNKEPRTMIGQKVDGSFVLVVVDGRSNTSKGMTASEQAQTMLGLGCINAVNLDGGGSSTMVTVKDGVAKVYNKLPNSVQRAVGSVFLVEEV